MYWQIQSSDWMTFGEMVRSRVLVLATKEDDLCLGKRNRGKMGRKIVETIQYLADKLNEKGEQV